MAERNFVEKCRDDPVDIVDSDDAKQLRRLGLKQQFSRSIGALDSFASSFCAVNFIGSVRLTFFLGILAGGPLAMWSSFLINGVTVCLTSAILAEICSALPISGSVYIWAATAAGLKYGRLVGFVVAWWVATAWMTFTAVCCQGAANYMLSIITVYDLGFPGGVSNSNIKWRVVVWVVSEAFLVLSAVMNYLPPRWYSLIFRTAMAVIFLDFALCLIWLPIGVSGTYGLRTAQEAFLTTYNGTGASPGWNWMLSFLFTSSILVGFDAAGHVAEETKKASTTAARSIFHSAVATSIGALVSIILFLFCTPSFETLFSLSAPQPFVLIYAMALGRGGAVLMTVIATISVIFSTTILIMAASRIIFAIARDGALPFSSWVRKITPNGRPQNAVMVVVGFSAILLCAIIPSAAAFTSLMSGGVVPLIAAYGLIALLRLTVTPNEFRNTKFPLGRARKLMYATSAIFNAVLFVVLVSPFSFPVSAATLNFGGIVFAVVTVFGVLSFWLTPEDKWLSREKIREMCDGANNVSGPQADDLMLGESTKR